MKKISPASSFTMNLWTLSTIASKKIDGKLGSIHGISFTEYMVLFHLKHSDTRSVRRIDLAQNLGLTPSGVTRLLAPLEKIGLIQKEVNERDARVSLVQISSSGERVLDEATLSLEEISNFLLQGINANSLKESLAVFKLINKENST
ncbi:MAG: MarR family transcriptional regulator [uncultured Thiotrichaceae bacterium]|uniref:MarR family transcriptional regulator n=1 Tax=uncultured Thiotrichaceae bacterium TaxID=298394 RepID=A0A6S6T4P8_9GAMM|nr:MAG: MarR family transcriptional regulator [uncultured Thiotrichaceae bacterium]